jgi:hypothetical protein
MMLKAPSFVQGKLLFGILLNHEPGMSREDVDEDLLAGTADLDPVDWLRRRWPNMLRCGGNLIAIMSS